MSYEDTRNKQVLLIQDFYGFNTKRKQIKTTHPPVCPPHVR